MSAIFSNFKIQKVNEGIYRFEKGINGEFNNQNTLFIPNKESFLDLEFNYEAKKDLLIINDFNATIKFDTKNEKILIYKDDKLINRIKLKKNSGELPLPIDTKDFFILFDNPRLTLKSEGYRVSDNDYKIEEDVFDCYLIFTNKNHEELRKKYIFLTGKNELVRLSTLGSWDSRYYPYSDHEALEIMDEFFKHDLPLDNFVIDTDWRQASERGIGYDINLKLFPNMRDFFNKAHSRNVEIMFNDHPEPVISASNCFDNKEIEYRKENLTRLLDMGLDYWWYDRNWITRLISPNNNLLCETCGLYLFHEVTKDYFDTQVLDKSYSRRPILMGNIVNVMNGNYLGINDSASHRYSIQWSGDINSGLVDLEEEINNLVKCTNNLVSYFSSDVGGHIGNPNKDEYKRWIEFGAFEPIFRPHCTISVTRFREPWLYDEDTVNIYRKYVNMRYHLMPYIYAGAFNDYQNGIPPFRGLAYNYPNDKKSNKELSEYMLNKNILIAPFSFKRFRKFDKNNYKSKVEAEFFNNTELIGEPVLKTTYDKLEFSLNGTPIEEGVNIYDFSARFKFKLKFKRETILGVAVDDGIRIYVDNELAYDDWSYQAATNKIACRFEKDKLYDLVVEYRQGSGSASLEFKEILAFSIDKKHIYLPNDEWFDLVNGEILNTLDKNLKYDVNELPLFIRCGSLIPLINHALNTKVQDWSKFIFDFYPSKTNSDSGYIYEDDHETVAYKFNEFRKTPYECFFDKENNAYLIKIHRSEGTFKGSNMVLSRDVLIKLENIFNEEVSRVLVNNKEVTFKAHNINKEADTFNFGEESRLNSTVCFEFKEELDKEYEVKICLK